MPKSASAAAKPALEPLRIGVVGSGVMGKNHARVLADLGEVIFAGIADPDPASTRDVEALTGIKAFRDHRALLESGIDAVTIAAPTHLHHAIAIEAIERGLHVLVEKPIASTVAEGEAIVAAAKKRGVVLMVGHVERFNPAVEAIKTAIAGEELLSISITRVGPFPSRMSNVGVVIDLAVHDIDLIRWFTGSDIVEVQPLISRTRAEREDIALLQFRTANGVLAHINTNWLTPFKARTVEVATRNKYITGDLLTRQVSECFDYRTDGSYAMRHLPVAYAEPLRVELLDFIGAIRKGGTPKVTGAEGVASLAVAIACLEGESGASPAPVAKPRKAAKR